MAYRWWGEPRSMFEQMMRLQQRAQREAEGQREFSGVYPAVNIYDDGESFLIRAEIPGVDKAKLDITTKGNRVSVRGERARSEAEAELAYHRRERDMGVFHRVVTLPEQVDATKTQASCNNGVLEIMCPRAEVAKARRVQVV